MKTCETCIWYQAEVQEDWKILIMEVCLNPKKFLVDNFGQVMAGYANITYTCDKHMELDDENL